MILLSLTILGLAVGQYARGGPMPLLIGQPLWVTDIHDDQKLAGLSNNIWFGQVSSKFGQVESKDDEPHSLYTVTVLESLKGTLPDTVTVVQYGVDFSDGTQYRVEGDLDLLEPGRSYLFVTKAAATAGQHVVVPGVGNLLLSSVEKNVGRETVLDSDDANRLRMRFQDAIENQVPFEYGDPPSGSDGSFDR